VTYGLRRRTACLGVVAALLVGFLPNDARAIDTVSATPAASLDHGFQLLYNLDFDQAHRVFLLWGQQHPDDPLGPACDAAGFLFSEFSRLGVLESQFLEDDKAFDARKKLDPNPAVREHFNAALDQAEAKARARLARDPRDRNALFALTLSSGLRADYAALIEKRNLASLHFTKQADSWAQQLLAVDANCYDAHVATGFSKYIIGSMSAPVRWLVRLGGVSGDKQAGIAELKLTAEHGQYLAPFARILLAIAYVRDKDKPRAREILASLRDQFPANPLFPLEIARLDSR
jgi:hypothetical protein